MAVPRPLQRVDEALEQMLQKLLTGGEFCHSGVKCSHPGISSGLQPPPTDALAAVLFGTEPDSAPKGRRGPADLALV